MDKARKSLVIGPVHEQLLDYFNLDLNGEVNEWPSVLKANAEGEVALEKLKVLANYNFMSADSNEDEILSRPSDGSWWEVFQIRSKIIIRRKIIP